MKTQTFSNHVRVHPLYHYVLVPVSLLLIVVSLANVVSDFNVTSSILFVSAVLIHLAIFVARDYAKKNQDRIIRTELRLRYFQLTFQRLEEIEKEFSEAQLLALRFADNEEFVDLLQDPVTRTLTPSDIKRQILQWQPDLMRV